MKDSSLENFDMVKIAIHLLILTCICLCFIVFLMIPSFKSYDVARLKNINQSEINKNTNSKLNFSQNNLDNLKEENKKVLSQFSTEFDIKDFESFAKQYFSNVKIQQKDVNNSKEEYLSSLISLSANVKEPSYFYKFIKDLSTYKNLLQIDYPLNFNSTNKNNIAIKINLKLYRSND
ncbi:hypothetical protein [Campylobacter avium]|uniref:hypothetical protein n=1 Tax=Campylobacter avium TaxID=522485 RepID=UPI002354E063|nr:hypothetical protein [Campylobacter avium]